MLLFEDFCANSPLTHQFSSLRDPSRPSTGAATGTTACTGPRCQNASPADLPMTDGSSSLATQRARSSALIGVSVSVSSPRLEHGTTHQAWAPPPLLPITLTWTSRMGNPMPWEGAGRRPNEGRLLTEYGIHPIEKFPPVIQNQIRHAWPNQCSGPCRLLAVLIRANLR